MDKFPIGDRGYFATVSKFNNFLMVHVRKYREQKPTKYGIALTVKEWRILMARAATIDDLITEMQNDLLEEPKKPKEARKEPLSERLPIGYRAIFAYLSEFLHTVRIHIRKFEDGLPTEKGVALNPLEWKILMACCEEIDEAIARKKTDLNVELKRQFKIKHDKDEPPIKKHCS